MEFEILDPESEEAEESEDDDESSEDDEFDTEEEEDEEKDFDAGIDFDSDFDPETLTEDEQDEFDEELSAKIGKITKKGLITLKFSHEMIIPANYLEQLDKYLSADRFYRRSSKRLM